jgi:hypothetical protein
MAGDGVLKACELRSKTKVDLEKQAVCCREAFSFSASGVPMGIAAMRTVL